VSSPRPATPADAPALAALERVCFPEAPWGEALLAQTLADRDTVALAVDGNDDATDGDDGSAEPTVLLAWGAVLSARGGQEADILSLGVHPSARRRGLGMRLLRQLGQAAAARGARLVFLEVRVDNAPAIALYQQAGFETVGRRPRYYQPGGVDALVMRAEAVAFEEPEESR
jgi:ribosomal protein S18 acetylase RimI-like enzyme